MTRNPIIPDTFRKLSPSSANVKIWLAPTLTEQLQHNGIYTPGHRLLDRKWATSMFIFHSLSERLMSLLTDSDVLAIEQAIELLEPIAANTTPWLYRALNTLIDQWAYYIAYSRTKTTTR